MPEPVIRFSNHAIDRLIQRFPELADPEQLAEVVSRVRPVDHNRLNLEAAHCGRPRRFGPNAEYLRDDASGLMLICRRGEAGVMFVMTVVRNRKPKKH